MIENKASAVRGRLVACLGAVFLVSACFFNANSFGQVASSGAGGDDSDKKTIQFNFDRELWDFVIPWFAEQAGFSLQPIDKFPEGTFYLKDDSEYTPMEALDQLNHALRMRNPPFTLIRNRNMLILAPLEDAQFPNDLIETVRADQLDQRGKYETIICIFEIGEELDIDLIFEEFRPLVSDSNRTFFAKFPAANQIRVRETGGALRVMRDILEAAKQKAVSDNKRMTTYYLKHTDAETFLLMARGQLDMEPNRDVSRDGSITITREPFGKRMFVRATEKMHRVFQEVAAVIDVAPEDEGMVEIKKQYFMQYPIIGDPELGRKLLETVLEGRGARMEQDQLTNAVMVLGNEDDHQLVSEALEALTQSGGQEAAIIPLTYGESTQILNALMNLMRLTAFESNPDAPVVFADSDRNAIVARGKPKDIAEIRAMISMLDENSKSEFNRSRSATRVLAVTEQDAEYLPNILDFLLQAEGRSNPIEVVSPQERGEFRSRIQQRNFDRFNGRLPSRDRQEDDRKDDSNDGLDNNAERSSRSSTSSFSSRLKEYQCFAVNWVLPYNASLLFSTLSYNPQDGEGDLIGRTAFDDDDAFRYRPADPVMSVPGAPIYVEFVEGRLVLQSDDLDALDDLEAAIRRELGGSSEVAKPKIFQIQYRRVNELKDVLENFFGLSSGSSEGGGNPLGNIMGNMLPMGNLFGDLFSSSPGSVASGTAELEGEVSFKIDLNTNYLFVNGATYNDLALISYYIELLDVPYPTHDPDFVGQTYTISVRHRDPNELKETVEMAYPQYIEKPQAEGGQGGGGEAAQAQAMMRMMQQLQGGGRGGGGGSSQEQKPVKVTVAVDQVGKKLIVTGPEYIFNKIRDLVLDLDQPTPTPRQQMLYMDRPQVDFELVRQMLASKYPGRIQFEAEDSTSPQQRQDTASNQQRGQTARPQQQSGPSAQDIQRMMQRMGGGGMGGGQQRGGQQRGGTGGGQQRGGQQGGTQRGGQRGR